jgi:hypothetical protein
MIMYVVQYKDHTSRGELRIEICHSEVELDQMWRHDASIITILDVRKCHEVFRVIVAGSRGFNDLALLSSRLDFLLQYKQHACIVIVSGTARGADSLGEEYARSRNYLIDQHPADWERYGKRAGYIRNEEMARNADALVAFWDGKSRGTGHMIEIAKRHNLPYRVEYFMGVA